MSLVLLSNSSESCLLDVLMLNNRLSSQSNKTNHRSSFMSCSFLLHDFFHIQILWWVFDFFSAIAFLEDVTFSEAKLNFSKPGSINWAKVHWLTIGFWLRMPASTAVFCLLIKKSKWSRYCQLYCYYSCHGIKLAYEIRNNSLHCNNVFQWEEHPQRKSIFSAKQLAVQGKGKVAQYFLLIFFQKEEKEVGSRVFQKNGCNSIRRKQTASVQAFKDWRRKQSRQ